MQKPVYLILYLKAKKVKKSREFDVIKDILIAKIFQISKL